MNNKQKSNKKKMVQRKKIGAKEEFIIGEFRPIHRKWTEEEIIENIKQIASKFKTIPQSKELSKLGYIGLSRAAERKFGNWSNALVAAGFNAVRKKWTKDKAVKQLKELYLKLSHSPSMNELKKLGKFDLLNVGLKFFGKYNAFLKVAGLSIVLEMNKWPKKRIISELRKIADEIGRTPRKSELKAMKRYGLINAAETYFPCWSDALIAADLIPNSDVLDDDKTWRQWEDLVFELLSKKGIIYEKKRYIQKVGYPDVYIPSKDKIIEIKLNCSDNSVKEDIRKYLDYCKTLEVWYLYGKPFGILSNKVSFVGFNRIREMIKDDLTLMNRFNEILSRIKNAKNKY